MITIHPCIHACVCQRQLDVGYFVVSLTNPTIGHWPLTVSDGDVVLHKTYCFDLDRRRFSRFFISRRAVGPGTGDIATPPRLSIRLSVI